MIELVYEWICNPGREAPMVVFSTPAVALSISAVGTAITVRIEERLKVDEEE